MCFDVPPACTTERWCVALSKQHIQLRGTCTRVVLMTVICLVLRRSTFSLGSSQIVAKQCHRVGSLHVSCFV